MVVTKQLQTDVETIIMSAFSKPEFLQIICTSIAAKICEQVEKEISKVSIQLKQIQEEFQTFKEKVSTSECILNKKIDNIEQFSRRKNLRVFGLAESQTENVLTTTTEFFREKLGVVVVPSEIDRCHRVGKHIENKTRGIFISFASCNKKTEIFRNKKKLKGERQTIKEDLTKNKLKLYQDAVNKYGLQKCWTKNGQIYINSNGKTQVYHGNQDEETEGDNTNMNI